MALLDTVNRSANEMADALIIAKVELLLGDGILLSESQAIDSRLVLEQANDPAFRALIRDGDVVVACLGL